MNTCPHIPIEPALDRWAESHWHIHQMEANYHAPEPFRYSFNSFVRSIKEVPQTLTHSVQGNVRIRAWVKSRLESLNKDGLFSVLATQRNFIVHQGALTLLSHGRAGTMEGRRVKISFPFRVLPYETTDEAYIRYKEVCRTDSMMRSLIGPDCDSSPAIWRTWMIAEFPNRDLLDVAFDAWKLAGEVLSDAVVQLGGTALDLTMPCRHDTEAVQTRTFNQHQFFLDVDGIDLNEDRLRWEAERNRRLAEAAMQSAVGNTNT